MNPETHTCDCGYTWRHGQIGTHLCGPQYRKTIAELRAAAAPQVVADERAVQSAFEKAAGGCVFGDAARLDSAQEWFRQGYRAALAAALVQAQEPVGTIVAVRTAGVMDCFPILKVQWARNMPQEGTELYTAPVQPVAVTDGWKDRLYSALDAEFALREGPKRDEDGQRMGIVINDTQVGVEFAMRWVEQNIFAVAPAAQVDALNARRYEYLRSDDEGIEFRDYGSFPHPWRSDCPSGEELDKIIDSAIAAKAAS